MGADISATDISATDISAIENAEGGHFRHNQKSWV